MKKGIAIIQMVLLGIIMTATLTNAAETGCLLPADNWLVRIYSEGSGPYTFSMAVMDTTGALIPATGIIALSADGNPYVFETNANTEGVSLACDPENGTAYIFHDHAGRLTLSTIQEIVPVPVAAPIMQVSQSLIDFGVVYTGTSNDSMISITNTGTASLNITSVTLPSAPFSIIANTCASAPIAPSGSCGITVRFAPSAATSYTGSFTITSDGGNATIPLQGTGQTPTAPIMQVSPTLINFGSVVIGFTMNNNVTVTNTGTASLNIASVTLPSAPFSIVTNTCNNATVAPSGTCSITLRFAPSATTSYSGSFTITSNGGNAAIPLQGTGTSGGPGH